jgi:hypothetical protein
MKIMQDTEWGIGLHIDAAWTDDALLELITMALVGCCFC